MRKPTLTPEERLERARAYQREYQRKYRRRPGMKEKLAAYQKAYRFFGSPEQRRQYLESQTTQPQADAKP